MSKKKYELQKKKAKTFQTGNSNLCVKQLTSKYI